MELGWSWVGAGMELGWHWDGAGMVLGWSCDGTGVELGSSGTARQEEETLARGSAQGQTLAPHGGQPGWCLCTTSKANTGPRHAAADESWSRRGRIQPAASRRGQAGIRHSRGGRRQRDPSTAVAVAVGNTCGLLPGTCLRRALRGFPGKMEPLCPGPGPFPGGLRGCPPGRLRADKEGIVMVGAGVLAAPAPRRDPPQWLPFCVIAAEQLIILRC